MSAFEPLTASPNAPSLFRWRDTITTASPEAAANCNGSRHSLYAGLTDEGFVLPSCRFDREGAEALIRLAKNRLEDFDIPLPESRERLAEMLHSHAGIVTRVLRTKGMEELMEIGLMNIPQTTEKDIKDGGA